jgi:hypothetical protein
MGRYSTRFVVMELGGYRSGGRGGGRLPGISCQVIDTAWNHRLVATFRSDDPGFHPGRTWARAEAHRFADRLNQETGG